MWNCKRSDGDGVATPSGRMPLHTSTMDSHGRATSPTRRHGGGEGPRKKPSGNPQVAVLAGRGCPRPDTGPFWNTDSYGSAFRGYCRRATAALRPHPVLRAWPGPWTVCFRGRVFGRRSAVVGVAKAPGEPSGSHHRTSQAMLGGYKGGLGCLSNSPIRLVKLSTNKQATQKQPPVIPLSPYNKHPLLRNRQHEGLHHPRSSRHLPRRQRSGSARR